MHSIHVSYVSGRSSTRNKKSDKLRVTPVAVEFTFRAGDSISMQPVPLTLNYNTTPVDLKIVCLR